MEERQFDAHAWYQPNEPADAAPADLFEEAGLYRLRSREELLELNTPKKRSWVLPVVACVLLLVGAIVATAVAFAEDEPSAKDGLEDYKNYYEQFIEDDGSDGIDAIPRGSVNPTVELKFSASDRDELTLQALYAKCQPSVVGISTYYEGSDLGWGTGVVMHTDGYIITNTHVLDGADEVIVKLYDGTEYEAKLIGGDAISDISVIQIQAKGLVPAEFADSDLVQVGDTAIAIGNPLGEEFSHTMTTGIISGVSRGVSYMNRTMTLLQTSAALNSGNSGGALFNAYGQVIGITNMKMSGSLVSIEGLGFAIPTTTVKQMVDAIMDDGAVVGRPGLGVTVYDLNGGDEEYPDGMLVNSVTAGSDAEARGLQPGDVITAIDGKAATDITVLRGVIESKQVGDTVEVTVWRAGETLELTIALIDQNDM